MTRVLATSGKRDKIRCDLSSSSCRLLLLVVSHGDRSGETLSPTTMPAEIYNANPTVFATGKPSRHSSLKTQSLWMGENDSTLDDDSEVEEIDSDEIFGTYSLFVCRKESNTTS